MKVWCKSKMNSISIYKDSQTDYLKASLNRPISEKIEPHSHVKLTYNELISAPQAQRKPIPHATKETKTPLPKAPLSYKVIASQPKTPHNTSNSKYEKPSFLTCFGGFVVGNMVSGLIRKIKQPFSLGLMKQLQQESKLDFAETKIINDGMNKILVNEGLKEKGVEILKNTPQNSKKIETALTNDLKKSLKILPESIKEPASKIVGKVVKSMLDLGLNAFYLHHSKKVCLPEKDLHLSAFHEMGHAMNHTSTKIAKGLQKARAAHLLWIPLFITALCKTKKAPNEKAKNPLDKATDFIKKNIAPLTLLCFAPTLIEEAIATIKGNKFAKKVLTPELAGRVAKFNKTAYLTYTTAASLTALGAYAGVKVKDMIAKPTLIKE